MTTHESHSSGQPKAAHAHHDDSFRLMGRVFPFPVYTGVYIILAISTIVEVLLFELPRGFFTIPAMVIIAIFKAGLVIWFYMHLNKDSRVFALTLLIPTVLVIVCTLFLMAIPPTGY